MADPVWGLLSKASDDNETIEQAIARLIQVHNEDANAHDEAGQSLFIHKSQDHIDHLLGSVVADKLSHSEGIMHCDFESLDSWTIVGDVSHDDLLGAELYIEWGVTNLSRMWGTIKWVGHYLNYAKDGQFQTAFWLDVTANTKAYAMLGHYVNDNNLEGYGFQILAGAIKGFWGDGANPTFTAALGINTTTPHIYRAQYDGTNKNVKFYIDGALVATIEDIEPIADLEPAVYYRYEATGAVDGFMHVKDVTIARAA